MTVEYSPLQPESQNQFAASGLDPHAECFETNAIPGITDQVVEERISKPKRKRPGPITFFPRLEQTEFAFVAAFAPTGKRPGGNSVVGGSRTNLICERCLQVVTYLIALSRRCYSCRCISVLLASRSPLNRRDPTRAEWRRELATFIDRPITNVASRN